MQTISIGKNRQRAGKLQSLQRATVSPCSLFLLEKKCCKAPSSTRPYLLAWEETDRSRDSVTVLVDGLHSRHLRHGLCAFLEQVGPRDPW